MGDPSKAIAAIRRELQEMKQVAAAEKHRLFDFIRASAVSLHEQGLPSLQVCEALRPGVDALFSDDGPQWLMVMDTIRFLSHGTAADLPEFDEFCRKHGPGGMGDLIAQEQQDATEWAADLAEAGLSPIEALDLAKDHLAMVHNWAIALGGESPLGVPKTLAELQAKFYIPANFNSRRNVLAILDCAAEAIIKAPPKTGADSYVAMVAGSVLARMGQVRRGTAQGRYVLPPTQEREAIYDFAAFVVAVLETKFGGDRSHLSGRQWRLIKDAAYFLILLQADQDKQRRGAPKP